MFNRDNRSYLKMEASLVLSAALLTYLLYEMAGYQIVVLNLFFLPVVFAGFYLGRYRAGVLTLLCILGASLVIAADASAPAAGNSPLIVELSVTVWGIALGLTAFLVGTLSDANRARTVELHEAHVGVIEVLSRYLQSANPQLRARSNRVATLCQRVALHMRLLPKEADDIRVAALLHDMENIEITAKVLRKAIGELETEQKNGGEHTFHGRELMHSLGSVLSGALPLLLNQNEALQQALNDGAAKSVETPLGARIIRTVRAYDSLCEKQGSLYPRNRREVIDELRNDIHSNHPAAVLQAMEVIFSQAEPAARRALDVAIEAWRGQPLEV